MTVNEFLLFLKQYNSFFIFFFIVLPVLAFILGVFYRRVSRNAWTKYVYSIIVYMSTIPGTLAFLLIFYTMFFMRRNILNLNMALYFLPVVSMGLVLYIISRKIKFERLPGFGTLWGLILIVGLVCLITLVLYRLHFFIGFFASIQSLIIAGIILFFLFRYALSKIKGK